MNDVLKSLTIQERGGGKISGLRYDSQEPLEEKLGKFPFGIGEAAPLSATLDQLKGARIELKFGSDTVAGVIVSARLTQGTNTQAPREQLTLLLDNGELRTVDLSAAANVRLTDPQLQKQFTEYFAALAASRSKDKRSVYIDSTAAQQRTVQASYMIPMAVWKSSYRLIFGTDGKPMLEGWAIVDNTTGEDWTNINLSLVSGRPISFVSSLYEPKFVTRPTVDLPDDAAAGAGGVSGGDGRFGWRGVVVLGTEGLPGMAKAPPPPPASTPPPPQSASAGVTGAYLAEDAAKRPAEFAPSTLDATAAGAALGELFEYRIGHPVTIKKSESAMLPFLQQAIDSRKLLIYSGGPSEHPTNAAELTNSTRHDCRTAD